LYQAEEHLSEPAGILQRPEAIGKRGTVLTRVELRVGERARLHQSGLRSPAARELTSPPLSDALGAPSEPRHSTFARPDEIIDLADEPDHQELCAREQRYFRRAITEDLDLADHMSDAVNSLRIVLAADESVRTGKTIELGQA
jgi:hypothetical protein